jgi:hypothetical protein
VSRSNSLYGLHARLTRALASGAGLEALAEARPLDRRDSLLTLLAVHDLHTAPLERLGGTERLQHHPAVAALKWRLEVAFVDDLEARDAAAGWWRLPSDAVGAMRALGRQGLVPDVYRWLAEDASYDEAVAFLALEGGPDGGFDDLVAACQIGLEGEPKLELARNYWDEMGNGAPDRVHTELHRKLAVALDLPRVARQDQPVEALARAALGSLLATNRWLQPEMVGALGLLELQAGPRCRKVVAALHRLDAPEGAFDFYREHAEVDPRHGKDWVDKAVGPLARDPRWAAGMVRGARWRSLVNAAFFDAMAARFVTAPAGATAGRRFDYRRSTMAEANSLVLTSVAPFMSRAKS